MSTLKVGDIKHESFTGTTQLKLDSAGRVLVGTTTEGHANADDFTVSSSGDTGLTIRSGTSNLGNIYFSDATSGDGEYRGIVQYEHANDKLNFGTAAGTRLSIDSAGRVGIGTVSPDQPLHIKSNTPYIKFEDDNDNQDWQIEARAFFSIYDVTDSAHRLAVDGDGRIGIGTTSPSSFDSSADDLVINGSGNTGITINSGATSSTSEGNLVFAEGNGSGGTADEWRGAIQYKHGDDRMSFYTDNTERLRITTSGIFPVAHGQTFNSSQLPNGNSFQINTTSSSHGLSVTRYSANYAGYALNIGRSKSNTIGTNSIVQDGDDLGHITWYGADGTDFNQAAMISAQVDGGPSGGEDMPGRIIFKTSGDGSATPTERMRIATDGLVNIRGKSSSFGIQANHHAISNNNATSWALQVVNTGSLGYGMEVRVNSNTASREAFYVYSTANSEAKASILSNGTFYSRSNTYTSYSDVKLKENIADAKSQWNDIKAIKVRNFNFKTDDPSKKMLGVVAQELEAVCPNLVENIADKETNTNGERVETGTTTKSVKYSILYMKAIKCLQEAQAKIETLETKVAALEAK